MMNLFWPTYTNIETEINDLLKLIHVDDNQVNVYSSKICELILRSASEIESISKELYYLHGGTKKGNIHFDYVALEYLNQKWNLSEKVIVISSLNVFLTEKIIKPFEFNSLKNDRTYTYSWNTAYQAIKHDRANNLTQGSIKNLLRISAALFVLNIYFKNQEYYLGSDHRGNDFPINLGSRIFSIKFHDSGNGEAFQKKPDFDECIYTSKTTDKSLELLKKELEKQRTNFINLVVKSPHLIENLTKLNNPPDTSGKVPDIREIIGQEEHSRLFRESWKGVDILNIAKQLRHEALLNINQF